MLMLSWRVTSPCGKFRRSYVSTEILSSVTTLQFPTPLAIMIRFRLLLPMPQNPDTAQHLGMSISSPKRRLFVFSANDKASLKMKSSEMGKHPP